jgi:hypothetical protein
MNQASLNHQEQINDQQLQDLEAGFPVQFRLWTDTRLVLRRMRIKADRFDVHDEVILEAANA